MTWSYFGHFKQVSKNTLSLGTWSIAVLQEGRGSVSGLERDKTVAGRHPCRIEEQFGSLWIELVF